MLHILCLGLCAYFVGIHRHCGASIYSWRDIESICMEKSYRLESCEWLVLITVPTGALWWFPVVYFSGWLGLNLSNDWQKTLQKLCPGSGLQWECTGAIWNATLSMHVPYIHNHSYATVPYCTLKFEDKAKDHMLFSSKMRQSHRRIFNSPDLEWTIQRKSLFLGVKDMGFRVRNILRNRSYLSI